MHYMEEGFYNGLVNDKTQTEGNDSHNMATEVSQRTLIFEETKEKESREKVGKTATAADLEELIDRQEYRCAACATPLTPREAHLDHIQPVSVCDDDSVDNLQWLCELCNRMKGKQTMETFVARCKAVADHLKVL